VPVGYGDNPPVGSGTPGAKAGAEKGRPPKQPQELPPAGPHDDPALTNADSTPGTGTLPPPGAHDDVDATSS
jgi:hypothetical protein